jgi:hypothetical protein
MAMTARAGDTTEQPIKQLNEASDLIHWPEGFSPKQTDAGAGAIQSVPRPGCDEALPLKLWSLVAQDLVVRSLQVEFQSDKSGQIR